jgi:hypothetical protein
MWHSVGIETATVISAPAGDRHWQRARFVQVHRLRVNRLCWPLWPAQPAGGIGLRLEPAWPALKGGLAGCAPGAY